MSQNQSTSRTEVIDGGTDPVTGYQYAYVRRYPVMIEVEYGFNTAALTLHHFPAQRQPRDISHNLNVLPRRTYDGAKAVAIAIIEGREAASVNREGEAA